VIDLEQPISANGLRLWVAGIITIVVHTTVIVWWAATISANQQGLKELMLKDIGNLHLTARDHEERLRQLERTAK
jgi:hypothetical protein